MSRTGKTIIAIVAFVAVLIVLFGIFSYRLVMKSLPKYEKTVLLSMLDQPVKVYYDKFHVPHIYAMNSKDLFRMAGYICAQDRLWQMEFYRRMVRGTLSEIFGPQTLARDKLFRILAFNRTAAKIAAQLPDETREIVEAYTQGINTFLST
ncbi:MAG: penicillin acylase family protein, partial [Calditrichaeota bacterium]